MFQSVKFSYSPTNLMSLLHISSMVFISFVQSRGPKLITYSKSYKVNYLLIELPKASLHSTAQHLPWMLFLLQTAFYVFMLPYAPRSFCFIMTNSFSHKEWFSMKEATWCNLATAVTGSISRCHDMLCLLKLLPVSYPTSLQDVSVGCLLHYINDHCLTKDSDVRFTRDIMLGEILQ